MSVQFDEQLSFTLLQEEGVEICIFGADKKLLLHSPGLGEVLIQQSEVDLEGQGMMDLFPELVGYDDQLDSVLQGQIPALLIERVHRDDLRGEDGYITLRVRAYERGWLLVARNATTEGRLEQRITQQRNELSLLSKQLAIARTRLDELLRRFVPSAVVDDMLANGIKSELGGERREITVLFADLRGFTRWAEANPPEMVMDVLNNAFSCAVSVLLEAGATLDKFMGDALMAFFNAPNDQPDHASRALICAQKIRQMSSEQDVPQFGIGINTGLAVVGNIGTMEAMNYTAIGDAVNIAKRLEEMTAQGQVMIGRRTHQLADPSIKRISMGKIPIRGREQAVEVFELMRGYNG